MRKINVGVAQMNSRTCDLEGNLGKMLRIVKSASTMGVEALLFAETNMHSYDFSEGSVRLAEPLGHELTHKVVGWSQQFNITLLAGMLELDGDAIYNTHIVATPDGRVYTQRKHNVTSIEVAAGISAGPRHRTVFELNGVKCAILICADTGLDGIFQEQVDRGVEYLFIPTAGGGSPQDYLSIPTSRENVDLSSYCQDRSTVFIKDAVMSPEQAPFPGFAAANALGFDGNKTMHRGHCVIVDKHRIVRAQIPGTNIAEHHLDQFCHAVIAFD